MYPRRGDRREGFEPSPNRFKACCPTVRRSTNKLLNCYAVFRGAPRRNRTPVYELQGRSFTTKLQGLGSQDRLRSGVSGSTDQRVNHYTTQDRIALSSNDVSITQDENTCKGAGERGNPLTHALVAYCSFN